MSRMTIEDYIAMSKPDVKELDIQLGGKSVMIRAMSPSHNDELKTRMMSGFSAGKNKAPSVDGLTIFVLLRSLCDETGKLIFDPKSEKDAAILDGISGRILKDIFDAAWAWSGWDDSAVDGLEKN